MTSVSAPPLTDAAIRKMAANWYQKLDVHAPMIEILPMLSEKGLEMRFPEATLTRLAEFENWYQTVIRIFFDEVHILKVCDAKIEGDKARVHIVVEWQASVWKPPAAKSERIKCDADQDWIVEMSPVTGEPVITTYIVNALNYHEGSAKL